MKMLNRLIRPASALVALTWAVLSHAQITIEIDRGYDNPKRIAVVPFGLSASRGKERSRPVMLSKKSSPKASSIKS